MPPKPYVPLAPSPRKRKPEPDPVETNMLRTALIHLRTARGDIQTANARSYWRAVEDAERQIEHAIKLLEKVVK